MYLHNEPDYFLKLIKGASDTLNVMDALVEKDYYVSQFNDDLKQLIQQVRNVRAATDTCPSAMPGIDINELLKEICEKDFFKKDYDGVTQFFVFDNVKYKDAKSTLEQIAEKFSD